MIAHDFRRRGPRYPNSCEICGRIMDHPIHHGMNEIEAKEKINNVPLAIIRSKRWIRENEQRSEL